MDKLFRNKYRIPSARASWWDYGWAGAYFVTICTQHRECYFGNVVNGEMHLSEIGIIAQSHWLEIPQHFSFAQLGAFVIMPNHMHGIVIIDNPDNNPVGRDAINRVSTTPADANPATKYGTKRCHNREIARWICRS